MATKSTRNYDAKGNRVKASKAVADPSATARAGSSFAKDSAAGLAPASSGQVSFQVTGGPSAAGTLRPSGQTTPSSSVVATSESARNAVNEATSYLTRSEQRAAERRARREEERARREEERAAAADKADTGGAPSSDASAGLSTVNAIVGDLADPTSRGRALVNADDQEAAMQSYKREAQRVTRDLDRLSRNMDDRTSSIIDSISTEYQGLIEEQRVANQRFESGVTTAGLVSGRSRYAPEVQGGMLKAAVDQGIQKIEEIQNKRDKLILEAEEARDERRYKVLTAKMEAVRQTYRDEREFARQLQTDIRDAITFERTDEQYRAATLAPSLADALTGNPDEDTALIVEAARREGLSPAAVSAAVDEYNQKQEQNLPAAIREWSYLKSIGEIPASMSFLSYQASQKVKSGTSGAKPLSSFEARAVGLPELAGYSKDEIAQQMVGPDGSPSETPPQFLRDIVEARLGRTLNDDSYVQEIWDSMKTDPDLGKMIYGSEMDIVDPQATGGYAPVAGGGGYVDDGGDF